MRVKVTLNLDEGWVRRIDERRGLVPRSRFVEALDPDVTAEPRPGKPVREAKGPTVRNDWQSP